MGDSMTRVRVDVQGMYIEVLRGITQLLGQSKAKLVIEVSSRVGRACLLDLIESAGYDR